MGKGGDDNHPEKMCILSSLSNLTLTTNPSSASYEMCLVLSEAPSSKAKTKANEGHIFIHYHNMMFDKRSRSLIQSKFSAEILYLNPTQKHQRFAKRSYAFCKWDFKVWQKQDLHLEE